MDCGLLSRFVPALCLLWGTALVAQVRPTIRPTAREKKPAIDVFAEAKGKILRWQFEPGEVLELKKFSEQLVKSGESEEKRSVFHRVLLEVKNADPAKGYLLEGTFLTLLKSGETQNVYTETERYVSFFYLQPRGQFLTERGQYMPNIRSVPSFPENRDPALQDEAALEPGSSWEMPGEEVMRFAQQITVPFTVHYEYRGTEKLKTDNQEKNCHKFISNYELNYGENNNPGPRVLGYVTAVWFWDPEQGIPCFAQEDYNAILADEHGLTNEFKIKSRSFYRKYRARNEEAKLALAQKVKDQLNDSAAPTEVRVTDTGVAITLPDVLFATNSYKLNRDARRTLRQIGKLLQQLDNPHILVRGHTDSTGEEEYNQRLSQRRAEAVANYLIEELEISPDSISYEGRGSRDPVADNSLEEGRAKNRRVEIILLDK